MGYLSSKTMSSARSQPARAAPLGAPRCGAPPARGLPGRATATARPSAPSARARPTRKPAVAREPSLCGRHRLPALARDRVRRPYIPSSGGVLAPPSQGTCTLEGESDRGGGRNLTLGTSPPQARSRRAAAAQVLRPPREGERPLLRTIGPRHPGRRRRRPNGRLGRLPPRLGYTLPRRSTGAPPHRAPPRSLCTAR